MNKWTVVFLIGAFFSTDMFGQSTRNSHGINFLNKLSWNEVIKEAKSNNKLIFLDCYTTWCVPCKTMSSKVFTDSIVGRFVNEHYVPIKLQFDSTKNDDDFIKKQHRLVDSISKLAKITAYPTYLFFDQDGMLIHQAVGQMSTSGFLKLMEDCLDSNRQYFKLVKHIGRQDLDSATLRYIIFNANSIGDTKVNIEVADKYFRQLKDPFSRENIQFMEAQLLDRQSHVFEWFYKNRLRINQILDVKRYAEERIENVLAIQIVFPLFKTWKETNAKADWRLVNNKIAKQYDTELAKSVISRTKINWYLLIEDWPAYATSIVDFIANYGEIVDPFFLNNYCWAIFEHSNNKSELKTAANWMKERVVPHNYYPQQIDTYANLLYKIGDVQAAIEWEEKAYALALAKDPKEEGDEEIIKEIEICLQKMKSGIKTWE